MNENKGQACALRGRDYAPARQGGQVIFSMVKAAKMERMTLENGIF